MASFEGDAPTASESAVLPDRRELALVALERTRMPMVITDPRRPDNPIVLANQAFFDLTGYSPDEVLNRNCRFLQGEDTDPADVESLRQQLVEDGDHISVEILNYRKDGSSFWNQLAVSSVYDDSGELIYYFASQKDVTATRRAQELEETERLLLKEVDHRAMNALALVQSLVRQSRGGTPNDHAALILGRVDALARAHRLLAAAGWSGADLQSVIAGEIADTRAQRVQASGPTVQLSATLVQPLALVLHELMLNAQRHGALRDPEGRLTIQWEIKDEHLEVSWVEQSLQTLTRPTKRGLGLSMLTSIVERQLGGRTTVAWDEPGFSATIGVPINGRAKTA